MKVLRDADGQPHRWQAPIGLEVGLAADERPGFHLDNEAEFENSARFGWPSIVTAASKAFGSGMKPDPGQPAAVLEPFVRFALDAVVPHVFSRSIPGFGVNGVRRDDQGPMLLLAGPFKDHRLCATHEAESRVLVLEVQAHRDVALVVVAAALLRKGESRGVLEPGCPLHGKWTGFQQAE